MTAPLVTDGYRLRKIEGAGWGDQCGDGSVTVVDVL